MKYNRSIVLRIVYIILIYVVYYSIFKKLDIKISYIKNIGFFMLILSYYVMDILNFKENNSILKEIIFSFFINFIYFFIIFYINKQLKFINIFILYTVSQILIRYILLKILINKIRILVIGNKKYNDEIKKILEKSIVYDYIGYINNKDFEKDCIGEIKDLDKIVEEKEIDEIIFINKKDLKETSKKILDIKLKGINVIDYISFLESIQGKINIEKIDDFWVILNDGFVSFNDNIQKRIKRIMDVTLSIIFLIINIPTMIISAIVIKLGSSGSVIYRQKRVGQNQKEFTLYKFRSMNSDAEKDGPKWAVENDPRMTKYGNFMRKSRIDELPQLINILRGDMSFVGPRPERKIFIEEIEKKIPYYNVRHIAKPGLTGWAQVMYPYGSTMEDAKNKLEYDLYYIRHQEIILDIMILFKTIKIVLFRKGR